MQVIYGVTYRTNTLSSNSTKWGSLRIAPIMLGFFGVHYQTTVHILHGIMMGSILSVIYGMTYSADISSGNSTRWGSLRIAPIM